jgi:obg-like ATPase 1
MYPAYLQVTDIAGLIKGASEGQGLGNAFLSHIQAVDGMFHIVRAFDNDEVLHVDDSIDPVRDLSKSISLYYGLVVLILQSCRHDSE